MWVKERKSTMESLAQSMERSTWCSNNFVDHMRKEKVHIEISRFLVISRWSSAWQNSGGCECGTLGTIGITWSHAHIDEGGISACMKIAALLLWKNLDQLLYLILAVSVDQTSSRKSLEIGGLQEKNGAAYSRAFRTINFSTDDFFIWTEHICFDFILVNDRNDNKIRLQ